MKRILISLIALLYSANAYADNVSNLMGLGMPGALAAQIDAQYGTAVSASIIPGADNTYDLGSASFSWRDLFVDRNALVGGTLGVTGTLTYYGSILQDATTGGSLVITKTATGIQGVGAIAVNLRPGAGGTIALTNSSNTRIFYTDGADFYSDATNGGNINIAATGKTLAVDSGTPASACKGTVTATGTTAVTVSTTCAATGANIIIARTSAPSGTAICWTDTIVNGVSFNLDCSGAETGTFSWWILKEG